MKTYRVAMEQPHYTQSTAMDPLQDHTYAKKPDSVLVSDSNGSEGDDEKSNNIETKGKICLILKKTASSAFSVTVKPSEHTAILSQVITEPGSDPATMCPASQSPDVVKPSSAPGPNKYVSAKKRRRIDEQEIGIPLEYGWRRETRFKDIGGRMRGEVTYFAPCGMKFKQYPEIMKYISRNGIKDISKDNFSFSSKIKAGDFYETREGPQGVQWRRLNEEEIGPRMRAMKRQREKPPNPAAKLTQGEPRKKQRGDQPPNANGTDSVQNEDAKLPQKLQAQETARQAAQMRLLQKKEEVLAAKDAKKRRAIAAVEEKRKQKEQFKMVKQQEKINRIEQMRKMRERRAQEILAERIKRIEQIRKTRELRAQEILKGKMKRIEQIRKMRELRAWQILEAKKKKKEEAANAKLLEAEKRIKEKERRKEHAALMKAAAARKKAEVKERLKHEKQAEKRLIKKRKCEQRRLELELAKELKKPIEDMRLANQKPLPELPRIPGLILSGTTFSNCLMVVQFLRNFGKVLGLSDVPSLSALQEGLLNVGDSMGELQDLLVRLLSAAVCDPGVPQGHKAETSLGEHIMNIGINNGNTSEILQIFMEARRGITDLTESLKTQSFQALAPARKSSVLAFLVDELGCSKRVVSEIDKTIDNMSSLRRDKRTAEGKLRKLRMIHAEKTGKKVSAVGSEGGDEHRSLGIPTRVQRHGQKGPDSANDDSKDEDTDERAEEEDDNNDEERSEACKDKGDGEETITVEELKQQIENLLEQQNQIKKMLFESSLSLRSTMLGQDRFQRKYWIFRHLGGVFVEGMEGGKAPEENESSIATSTPPSITEPQCDKSMCPSSSAFDLSKPVDFPTPRPIPKEMRYGWWRITGAGNLEDLLTALHLRGIREKALHEQVQKHFEHITQTCLKNPDEINGHQEYELTPDLIENWSVEDQETEVDTAILRQVEELERRVASASLQMKGWICPELASEREDLVYYEHKSVTDWHMEHDGEHTADEGGNSNAVERKSDNPLDIAVTRLTDLERNIERRYLKSPLSTTIQIKVDNVGTVTVPAPSDCDDGTEDDIAPGLKIWRKALSEARSAAQISLCIQQLHESIAWEKSIMKVYCQICLKGVHEDLLLLCDGCDKGCHTYCHTPKLTAIPEDDWFCPACIVKVSKGTRKMSQTNLRGNDDFVPKKSKKSVVIMEVDDPGNSGKERSKEPNKRKVEESPYSLANHGCSASSKKAKPSREEWKDLTLCRVILSELESHEDAWPFLLPVDSNVVPGYRKVIKKPMDFATIREKLCNGQYPYWGAFALDVRLVFNNCKTFNEDDSEIGRAGQKVGHYFEKRWTELFNVS